MPTLYNRLSKPVVLVTKGRGREVFDDSAALFRRLEELPAHKETILSVQQGDRALVPDSVAALETLVWLQGFTPLWRAGVRAGAPFNRPYTRFCWAFLGDYLGLEWRTL